MINFSDMVLCDISSKKVDVHIRVSGDDEGLHFSGYEIGPVVDDSWGDDDYEYWYNLDAENAEKLLELIEGTDDPKAALVREFSGTDGLRKRTDLCNQNNIEYSFHSYV